ncbi:MAG: Crp/Fnr family transcriptional regulator [Acidobacteria bacterium]|nr:Crp/Fnr family transcriptional regulator [Acidobacteriota bacterium]
MSNEPLSIPFSDDAHSNKLIAALPDEDFERLTTHLELVSLDLGDVIYESGEKLEHLFLPTTAIISLLYIMENGSTAEIGLSGNDGLVGIALFMGGSTTPSRAVVQSGGKAFRLHSRHLTDEFSLGGPFQKILLRYTQALMTQIAQTAVCNRLHTVEQQLCRWLLINYDLLQSNKLIMTHDLIANMLGVRREGVSVAAGRFQKLGLIQYVRGTITMVDRNRLETVGCECYRVVKDEYDRLLSPEVLADLLQKKTL